ncbi:hypothetical protein IFR04_006407 [Cadophora malorum]|uniref:Cytochrome b561 domain-containing protein n=1 Tax=Cadophora malorum TaxID=108018 RepID=A0A8H7TJ15_9HELO|nr:hypothetical protein IFR04_006407 [Cadophora malorum]
MPFFRPLIAFFALQSLSSALQFCRVEGARTDLCFAIASTKNQTTKGKDVSLHLSARFEQRNGWVAFGIGEKMAGALMFVMYPGDQDGDITMSIRSTPGHFPPMVTMTSNVPVVHVTRTWVDPDGLHNAQMMCYDCETWTSSDLDVDSSKQSWIWSSNFMQNTRSDDPELMLNMHTDRGVTKLNMDSSYEKHPDEPVIAQVSTQRITMNEPKKHKEKHHKHKTFGLVSIHGFLLTVSFMSLSGGILAIRSGMPNSFKMHWIVQSVAGGAIVLGCLIGIWLSISHGGHFSSFHQIIGLAILPGMIAQGFLGYWHHINYVKLGRRTAISDYHVWVGRAVLAVGNINVGLGLKLGHATSTSFYLWFGALCLQLCILIPMWYFWSKGLTIMDVLKQGRVARKGSADGMGGGAAADYASVEQDPFIVDDDDLDDRLDDELDSGIKGRDLEMR